MTVDIKGPQAIEAMRVVGRMAAETLKLAGEKVRVGMTTEEINTIVHNDTVRRGAYPAPLNYRGFPKSVCTSVNEIACHGIPGSQVLKEGDIVNIDVTTFYQGFYGDTSATFYVGTPGENATRVTEAARKALELGIAEVKEGARLGDIGAAIQEYVESLGMSVGRDFVGHGIGRRFHEDPQVLHVGKRGTGIRLQAGMVFTIEPIVNLGGWEVSISPIDSWTVRNTDNSLSAQFEHTILVTPDGYELLTAQPAAISVQQ